MSSVSAPGGAPLGAQERVNQRVDLAVGLIEAAQGGKRALPELAGLVAKRLHQLHREAGAV